MSNTYELTDKQKNQVDRMRRILLQQAEEMLSNFNDLSCYDEKGDFMAEKYSAILKYLGLSK